MNEQKIIKGLAKMDESVIKAVLAHYLPPLLALVRKIAPLDKDTATSIIYDALIDIIAYIKKGKFTPQGPNSFARLFYTFVANKTKTHVRNYVRENNKSQTTSIDWEDELPDTTGILSDTDKDQLIQMDDQHFQQVAFLKDCIQQLTEINQQLMRLYYFEQRKWKDIATTLGLSLANVRTKSTRNKESLKRCLEAKMNNKGNAI